MFMMNITYLVDIILMFHMMILLHLMRVCLLIMWDNGSSTSVSGKLADHPHTDPGSVSGQGKVQ